MPDYRLGAVDVSLHAEIDFDGGLKPMRRMEDAQEYTNIPGHRKESLKVPHQFRVMNSRAVAHQVLPLQGKPCRDRRGETPSRWLTGACS
jgi:hypothetical protein